MITTKQIDLLVEKYRGRMNAPTASAYLKGICGDEIELYLELKEERIIDVKYFTNGCRSTNYCAAMTADLAQGQTLNKALNISAGQVVGQLKDIPELDLHCSILAVSVLYRALADYLLRF